MVSHAGPDAVEILFDQMELTTAQSRLWSLPYRAHTQICCHRVRRLWQKSSF